MLSGTLSMYLGDPPERRDIPPGGLVHVEPGTPLQTANHDGDDLILYAYGTPPERENAEILDPVCVGSSLAPGVGFEVRWTCNALVCDPRVGAGVDRAWPRSKRVTAGSC